VRESRSSPGVQAHKVSRKTDAVNVSAFCVHPGPLVRQVLLGVEVTLLRNNRSKAIVNPGPLPIPPMSIFGVKAFVIAKDEVRCVPGCGRLRLFELVVLLWVASGFLVALEKPNRSSCAFYMYCQGELHCNPVPAAGGKGSTLPSMTLSTLLTLAATVRSPPTWYPWTYLHGTPTSLAP
jgi:hypothetical protein